MVIFVHTTFLFMFSYAENPSIHPSIYSSTHPLKSTETFFKYLSKDYVLQDYYILKDAQPNV